jgi:uncharacterized metal-binding protein
MEIASRKKLYSKCGQCPGNVCYPILRSEDPMPPVEEAPRYCPMRRFPEIMEKVRTEYRKPDIREFARLASVQEAECYERTPEGLRTRFPRIEEIIQFAGKCNYTRLGIAFCKGLAEEQRLVSDILKAKGFEVVSVNCKVGGVPKEYIGITEEQKIAGPGIKEPMCNPVAQAEILNEEGVDLALMLGLCVGHDTLFLKYILAPCTVLAVKDRVFGHNPLAAAYLSRGPYYGRLRNETGQRPEGKKITIPESVRRS